MSLYRPCASCRGVDVPHRWPWMFQAHTDTSGRRQTVAGLDAGPPWMSQARTGTPGRGQTVAGLVAGLRIHETSAQVQEKGFAALSKMALGHGTNYEHARQQHIKQDMVDAGAIEAVVAGLRAHIQLAKVQEKGFTALCNLVSGDDTGLDARAQRMAAAGSIELAVAVLKAHTMSVDIQERAFGALCDMSHGDDEFAEERSQRMAKAVRQSVASQ